MEDAPPGFIDNANLRGSSRSARAAPVSKVAALGCEQGSPAAAAQRHASARMDELKLHILHYYRSCRPRTCIVPPMALLRVIASPPRARRTTARRHTLLAMVIGVADLPVIAALRCPRASPTLYPKTRLHWQTARTAAVPRRLFCLRRDTSRLRRAPVPAVSH